MAVSGRDDVIGESSAAVMQPSIDGTTVGVIDDVSFAHPLAAVPLTAIRYAGIGSAVTVIERRREYAIRSSLGAGRRSLERRLVLGRGLQLSTPGLAAATSLTFLVVTWLRDDFIMPAISPLTVTLASVAALLALLFGPSVGPVIDARQTQAGAVMREE